MRPTRDPARIQAEEEVAKAMEAFLSKGGKVQEIPSGKQDLEKVPFTITSEKQKWKEGGSN